MFRGQRTPVQGDGGGSDLEAQTKAYIAERTQQNEVGVTEEDDASDLETSQHSDIASNEPQQAPPPSVRPKEPLSELEQLRQDAFTAARLQEETGILMLAISGIVTELFVTEETDAGYVASFIGAIVGLGVASGYFIIRKKLPQKWQDKLQTKSINTWARRFKTSFVFGQKCGEIIGSFVPVPDDIPIVEMSRKILTKVLGYALGIIFGIIGFVFFKGDLTEANEKFLKLGKESWTKYGKTGLVFGTSVGATIGGLIGALLLPHWGGMLGNTAGGAIGGAVGFVAAIALVPVYNYIKLKWFTKAKPENAPEEAKKGINRVVNYVLSLFSDYRTNYIRTGMTLGGSIGGVVGGVLGAFVFPVLGPIVGAMVGNAIGSVIGGIIVGIGGPLLAKYLSPDSANSYDYGFRSGEKLGSLTGAGQIASPFVPDVGIVCVSAGGAVAGLIGAGREVYHGRQLKKQDKKDEDHVLPWTTRAVSGVVVGSAIGGLIGLAFPPFGPLIGSGAGGLIGGLLACAAEPLMKWLGFIPKPTPKAQPEQSVSEDVPQDDNHNDPRPDVSPSSSPIPILATEQSAESEVETPSPSPQTNEVVRFAQQTPPPVCEKGSPPCATVQEHPIASLPPCGGDRTEPKVVPMLVPLTPPLSFPKEPVQSTTKMVTSLLNIYAAEKQDVVMPVEVDSEKRVKIAINESPEQSPISSSAPQFQFESIKKERCSSLMFAKSQVTVISNDIFEEEVRPGSPLSIIA